MPGTNHVQEPGSHDHEAKAGVSGLTAEQRDFARAIGRDLADRWRSQLPHTDPAVAETESAQR